MKTLTRVELLGATAELMGHAVSGVALAMMAKDFEQYDIDLLAKALTNVRLNQQRFSQAAIQKEIDALKPDGRVGADEAWALYPHDESVSAVITNEISEAMAVAQPLLLEGDKIGARMAFKEAYNRITSENKAAGIEPKWFASLGTNPEGREPALKRAVELGRLSASHAVSLLPSQVSPKLLAVMPELRMLTSNQEKTPEQKQAHEKRMQEIRKMLEHKGAA